MEGGSNSGVNNLAGSRACRTGSVSCSGVIGKYWMDGRQNGIEFGYMSADESPPKRGSESVDAQSSKAAAQPRGLNSR